MKIVDDFAGAGSKLATVMFLWTMLRPYIPHQLFTFHLNRWFRGHIRRLAALIDPYLSVTIAEYEGERMKQSKAYEEAKAYLSNSCSQQARRLKAESASDSDQFMLSMGDHEEVVDEFHGATVWWVSVTGQKKMVAMGWPAAQEERRYYKLVFHEKHRELVVEKYLPYVRRAGRAVMVSNRRRKLFTNVVEYGHKRSLWSHVVFKHPSTFETLAMDPAKKQEIIDDLDTFRRGKDYYERIGKAWKRGYLLYGPPGTGKSSMIAAIANYLDYDIYDVELTSVNTNTDLRKLFIETKSKSIIVIEDIDCSLELTGERKDKKKKTKPAEEKKEKKDDKEEDRTSKVTLSGLLNCIDGLWSACGDERIIVFTTNHIDRLDPALIRRGRMDKHIEMSYCCFESFKVLAMKYLLVETHELFDQIEELLPEVKMTPADVAENLMPKCAEDNEDACLERLVEALVKAKEEAAKKGSCKEEEEEEEADKKNGKQEQEQVVDDE